MFIDKNSKIIDIEYLFELSNVQSKMSLEKNKLEFIFHLIFDLLDDKDILGGCIDEFQYFSILLQNEFIF